MYILDNSNYFLYAKRVYRIELKNWIPFYDLRCNIKIINQVNLNHRMHQAKM